MNQNSEESKNDDSLNSSIEPLLQGGKIVIALRIKLKTDWSKKCLQVEIRIVAM